MFETLKFSNKENEHKLKLEGKSEQMDTSPQKMQMENKCMRRGPTSHVIRES